MDVLFQLFIPHLQQIEGLERHQPNFSWAGVNYPQERTTYRWGRNIELLLFPIGEVIQYFGVLEELL